MRMTVGTIPQVMRSIELYGSQVALTVRKHLAGKGSLRPSAA